jgi:hypothetical protein
MARTVKDNWRDSIRMTSTEIVTCDTPMPIDVDRCRMPLLFNVRPVPNQVIDTKNIRLFVKFRILKNKEGEYVTLDPKDKVSPQNNFGFGLFEDVQLTINGIPTESSQREYARSSYLKNLLFTSASEKRMLEGAWFHEDQQGYVDRVDNDIEKNYGEATRTINVTNYEHCSLLAPVYLDTLQAGVYFPDHVGFTLRFYPARTVTCVLYSGGTYDLRLEILESQLFVPRCLLSSLPLKTFSTHYENMKVLSYVSPKEVMSFSKSLNTNQVPKKLAIIVQTEKQHRGGHMRPSIIKFGNHDVKCVRVRCNGQTYPTAAGMNMDFEKNLYHEAYNALFTELKAYNTHFGCATFETCYCIFGVDLPPGHRSSGKEKNGSYGTCDLELEFSKAPNQNLVITVFCFFDSQFSFNDKGFVQDSAE